MKPTATEAEIDLVQQQARDLLSAIRDRYIAAGVQAVHERGLVVVIDPHRDNGGCVVDLETLAWTGEPETLAPISRAITEHVRGRWVFFGAPVGVTEGVLGFDGKMLEIGEHHEARYALVLDGVGITHMYSFQFGHIEDGKLEIYDHPNPIQDDPVKAGVLCTLSGYGPHMES
jgi:hypothetical protein